MSHHQISNVTSLIGFPYKLLHCCTRGTIYDSFFLSFRLIINGLNLVTAVNDRTRVTFLTSMPSFSGYPPHIMESCKILTIVRTSLFLHRFVKLIIPIVTRLTDNVVHLVLRVVTSDSHNMSSERITNESRPFSA